MMRESETTIQVATGAHIRDVWFDGNEEIVEVGATCPNDDCRYPVVATFTRPRITTKVIRDRRCGESMLVIRPAFGFERDDSRGDEMLAQRPAVTQPFQPENVSRLT